MNKTTSLITLMFIALFLSGTTPSFSADDEANKKILKDAITGAVTGAVAVEATKDEGKKEAVSNAADQAGKAKEAVHGKSKKHKNRFVKNKKRPYGWDQGKKTGWGGGDEPPGLAKKNKD